MQTSNLCILLIALLSIAGVIIRPFKIPEVIWAVSGALLLLIFRLIAPIEAWDSTLKGLDVYLFLLGMMMLAETARNEGVFEWLAEIATKKAKGSAKSLFLLIYLVGVVVTALMSNDATAVVLTPAVAAAVRSAGIKNSLPYLFICAFIANAASFILPISNPANLVIYGSELPGLMQWVPVFLLPSIVAVVTTFFILRFTQRKQLTADISKSIQGIKLTKAGKVAAFGILFTSIVLMIASACRVSLGVTTAIMGIATSTLVLIFARKRPTEVLKGISWSVVPLVAGLFILVGGVGKTGILEYLSEALSSGAQQSESITGFIAGTLAAFGCNLLNNLPAGLIVGHAVQAAHVSVTIKASVAIGIDLGPNLSLTGSLATILWLIAIRREGLNVSGWTFLKTGALVMIPTLFATLAAIYLVSVFL